MSDRKVQMTIFTYPELVDCIPFLVRIIEAVFEKGRVEGLREAERIAASASGSESDRNESGGDM